MFGRGCVPSNGVHDPKDDIEKNDDEVDDNGRLRGGEDVLGVEGNHFLRLCFHLNWIMDCAPPEMEI